MASQEPATQGRELLAELMAGGDLPPRQVVEIATPPAVGSAVQSLSVVVPARNEAINLRNLMPEIVALLARLSLRFSEVIVVDDGSSDTTGELATAFGARVVRHAESLGNGAAVKRGIREAAGEWILLLDGDGQHPPDAVPAMVAMAQRYDMVVGSRGGKGGNAHRNFANRVYNLLASYVSGKKIPDLTSGFRLLRAEIAKDLVYLLPNTFSYPTTITMSMLRAGYGVGFHPIAVRARKGKSHVRLVADGSRFFLIILRIATFFAPLRVFLPLSLLVAGLGVGWYVYTYVTEGRFTNMAVLLLGEAMLLFALGLISEQIAALRFQRMGSHDARQ